MCTRERVNRTGWLAAAVIAAALPLTACLRLGADAVETSQTTNQVATVEPLSGTELSRVTLTEQAVKRLQIQTAEVQAAGTARATTTVPYGAVLYDAQGGVWVYTSPAPGVYVRHRITIDSIEQGTAVLSEGPPAGTIIVTEGASMLFGTEFESGN